jgi:hypothetical protein
MVLPPHWSLDWAANLAVAPVVWPHPTRFRKEHTSCQILSGGAEAEVVASLAAFVSCCCQGVHRIV